MCQDLCYTILYIEEQGLTGRSVHNQRFWGDLFQGCTYASFLLLVREPRSRSAPFWIQPTKRIFFVCITFSFPESMTVYSSFVKDTENIVSELQVAGHLFSFGDSGSESQLTNVETLDIVNCVYLGIYGGNQL